MSEVYIFAGHCVSSSICLASLPTAHDRERTPEFLILAAGESVGDQAPLDWLHHWRHTDGTVTLSLAARAGDYLLRVPELCDFIFSPATRRITVSPLVQLSGHSIEHLLLDQILPRVLAHVGEPMLHAAMVEIDGNAVLLLGDSGTGKSTLAAHLHEAGHRVHSDDCVLIRMSTGSASSLATYPSLRLNPDSLARIACDGEPMAEYSEKRRVKLAEGQTTGRALAISAIYRMDPVAADTNCGRIEPIAPMQACIALMKQAFSLDVTSPSEMGNILHSFGELANRAPAFSLDYPRRFEALPELVTRLVRHARGVASAQPCKTTKVAPAHLP